MSGTATTSSDGRAAARRPRRSPWGGKIYANRLELPRLPASRYPQLTDRAAPRDRAFFSSPRPAASGEARWLVGTVYRVRRPV